MDTAAHGEIGVAELEALERFCPCHLADATEVRDLLLAMLLAEHEAPLDETDGELTRRHTLLLLLAIAEVTSENLGWRFRKYTYAAALTTGAAWELPAALDQTRSMWATYQRHELFSVAVQGLFSIGLRRFKAREPNLDGVHFRSVADYVAAYMAEGVGFDRGWLERPFPSLVEELGRALPSLDDFHHDDHEFQRFNARQERPTSARQKRPTQEQPELSEVPLGGVASPVAGRSVPIAATLRAMPRTRPCRICRRWFQPHPRAGARQRVCSEPVCQRERHRRSCADWRRENATDEKAERLRRRLREPLEQPSPAVLAGLRLDVVRDVVSPELAVIIEETGEVLGDWVRDAVRGQGIGITEKSGGLPPAPVKDAIASGAGPP